MIVMLQAVTALLPAAVEADPPTQPNVDVTVSKSFDQVTQLWTYTYTVENKSNSPSVVSSFTLLGVAPLCDPEPPSQHWWLFTDWRGADGMRWRAQPSTTAWTSPHSIQVGTTLTGFTIKSFAPPGELAYVCEAELPPVSFADEEAAAEELFSSGGYDQPFSYASSTAGTVDGPVGIVTDPCPQSGGGTSRAGAEDLFALGPGVPNPFSGSVKFELRMTANSQVSIRIYDVSGRLVRSIVDGTLPAGTHHISWDGRNVSGSLVPIGTYCTRMVAGSWRGERKIILLRH